MKERTIDRRQARRFILTHQGLWPPHRLKGKPGIMSYIKRVGCIQFDPLNIVGFNQDLVLQARLAGYKPGLLQELLYRERKLLDGWDKNMSIYSTADWPCFSRRRRSAREKLGHNSQPVVPVLPRVRQALEELGPLCSADLDFEQTVDWPWGPTRISRAALESMYFWGELVVHHKVHTRRVYDLAHRHLPASLLSAPDPHQTEEQYHDWYIHRRIGGIGLLWNRAGDAWLGISGIKGAERQAAFTRLMDQGTIVRVCVAGLDTPFYIRREDSVLLEQSADSGVLTPRAAILAPLDNLLWDRRLVKALFDFDYTWEVYKPAAERRYGYYVLPVLYGDRFVARFDPGRDKQNRALVIKNWWWEPGVKQSKKLQVALKSCFKRFLKYLGAGTMQIDPAAIEKQELHWLSMGEET